LNPASGLTSLLFVPGSKPERFVKALASGADVVCIDLEDSVPLSGKAEARDAAIEAISRGESRLVLRINALTTRAGLEDLLALADATHLPTLLLVPMVQNPSELGIIMAVLGARTPSLIPLIETVNALRAAHEIASAPGVVAMMFGGADFAADLGVELAWEPLRSARSAFVMACAGAGIPAIDVPFIALDNEIGLIEEARAAQMLGFTAKAAIHPAQVGPIATVFRPTPEEIAEAQAAAQAFVAAGGAAVRFNGRMLEAPIMRKYQRILAMGSNQNA
jgi:(S)-citramalyl-CoA lyase